MSQMPKDITKKLECKDSIAKYVASNVFTGDAKLTSGNYGEKMATLTVSMPFKILEKGAILFAIASIG